MSRWSTRHDWTNRVELYDADLDRRVQVQFVEAQIQARERHARMARETLTVLMTPMQAMIDALRDPAVVERLTLQASASPAGFIALLRIIIRCTSVIPAIVAVERLALGMSKTVVEADRRQVSFINPIHTDPEALALAIALIEGIGGTEKVGVGGTVTSGRNVEPLERTGLGAALSGAGRRQHETAAIPRRHSNATSAAV